MFNSIRWKFIVIYMLLIFIGMLVAGVFIVQSYESYHFDGVDEKLNDVAEIILPSLEGYDDLMSNSDDLQLLVDNAMNVGFREEVYIISASNNLIVATTTTNAGRSAMDMLEFSLLRTGLTGEIETKTIEIESGKTLIRTMDRVFPIKNEGKVTGLLYVRYDLKEVFDNLNNSMNVIIQATFLALLITFLIGSIVSKSITDPINEITAKASRMASGHFDQLVEVKSNDEIGKLGEMFNILTKKLDTTLNEISREKSKLETIINYMDDGLIAVSKDNHILHLNPKVAEMLNLKDETIEDFNFFISVYDPKLAVGKILENDEMLLGSEIISFKESIYRVNYAPYKNDRGILDGIVYVFQDVTEQQKLDELRKDFVANVSHELKTPLTSIKSYTETILDGMVEDVDMQRQFLGVVNSEADRMTRLVRDLLQLSNFDAKKVVFDKEFNDYIELLNKSMLKLQVTAKQKSQEFTFKTDLEKMEGYFDYDRIEQVVLNVMSNAIKYTPENGKVAVELREEDAYAVIAIKDTGLGIPSKDIPFVFDRFYRVDKARSREMGGTGLGLSIAREIVESHGGEIDVQSVVDVGTTMTIYLPLETPEDLKV
jgi:two-component system sensor histidine kinase VicK